MMVLVLRLAKLVRVSDMVLLLLLMPKLSIYEHLVVWGCCHLAWQSLRIWQHFICNGVLNCARLLLLCRGRLGSRRY